MRLSSLFILLFMANAWLNPSLNAGGRPDIALLVADDMGYADLGTQGARGFQTPHLDRLARHLRDSLTGVRPAQARPACKVVASGGPHGKPACHQNEPGENL
jgi:hypothetical protein